MDPVSVIVWIFVAAFLSTAIITLCGIVENFTFIKVPDKYLKPLYVALLLEIVGASVTVATGVLSEKGANTDKSPQTPTAQISPYLRDIKTAEKRVQMLGINFLGSLHDQREHLINILNNGAEIQVLLFDARSAEFCKREKAEGQHKNNKISYRLMAESKAAFEIIRDIRLFSRAGTIELRVFDEAPTRSILIVDNEIMQSNIYPTTRAPDDQAEVKLSRGVLGQIGEFKKGNNMFEQKTNEFTDLWDKHEDDRIILDIKREETFPDTTVYPFNPISK